MVARDAAERERERACDGVLRGRESSWCACNERENTRCGVLREGYEEF